MKNVKLYLKKIIDDLKMMDKKGIDVDFIIQNIHHQISNLRYFYCNLEEIEPDVDKRMYKLSIPIKEHTMVYVNLGIGFPKEIKGGHWCYVYKVLNRTKALVIPSTSFKENTTLSEYNKVIKFKYIGLNSTSILQLSDMRVIDLQRVYDKKGCIEVTTPRKDIVKKVNSVLNDVS